MALKDDIALLARIPIFQGLEEEYLRLLAFGAERRQLPSGQILFRQAEPADCAFVLTRGRLQFTAQEIGAAIHEKGFAETGTMLSELALVMATERRLTAIAVKDCEVLRITRDLFHRMLEEYPAVGKLVETRLREKFSTMTQALEGLAARLVL